MTMNAKRSSHHERQTFDDARRPPRVAWPVRGILTMLATASMTASIAFTHVSPVFASQLLAPCAGVPDSALNGATVATPLTPVAAAFSNPAGLTALEPGAMSFGLGVPVGHSRLHTTDPPDYDTTSDFVAFAPEGGAVFDTGTRVRIGFAVYGSLGASFDSDAEPAFGVEDDFLATQSISNLALMAAMPIGDRLSVGAALTGVYGQSHLRYDTFDHFAFTVRGPGVQAIFGLRYAFTDHLAVGLGARTPGMVWATGDDAFGSGQQDVDLDLDLPAQVFVGVNADVTKTVSVGLAGRWTDASTFSDSIFRFEETPQADVAFIRSASDEWRIATGASWRALESVTLRGSFGYADAIVPDTFVSPLLIDSAEWKISAGLSWDIAGWSLDATIGHSPTEARNVSTSEAVIFPGRYVMGGQIYMIGVRTTL
jgi:long-subunit fatty acid transport protein